MSTKILNDSRDKYRDENIPEEVLALYNIEYNYKCKTDYTLTIKEDIVDVIEVYKRIQKYDWPTTVKLGDSISSKLMWTSPIVSLNMGKIVGTFVKEKTKLFANRLNGPAVIKMVLIGSVEMEKLNCTEEYFIEGRRANKKEITRIKLNLLDL